MNTRNASHYNHVDGLDAELRALDPARTAASGPDVDARAQATLARVLDRVESGDRGSVAGPVASRGRTTRRILGVAGAAAALAVGFVVVPELTGGGAPLAWSATPQGIDSAQADSAEQVCLADLRQDTGRPDDTDLSGMRPVISERRGSYILVYLTDSRPAPSEVTCYVEDGRVVATGGSFAVVKGSHPSPPAPPVAANSLHGQLGGVYSTDKGSIRGVSGRVGADVTGVVLHTVAKGPVTATVKDGHFASWWPDAPTTEEKENAATSPEITGATVTLKDGSTREVSVEELSGRTTAELHAPSTGGGSVTN